MSHANQSEKSAAELSERAWKAADAARTATLITIEDNRAVARPMSLNVDLDRHLLHFLTSAGSHKVQHAGEDASSATIFLNDGNTYVSFTGAMSVSNDREKIKELWSVFAKAWWDSPEDPDIRLLTVDPSTGEIWDSPNTLVATTLMLSAAATGTKPHVGDHAQLRE